MSPQRSVFVPAYAKINWTLDVLGRRDDGYHELKSVMQTIALADVIRLTPTEPGTVFFDCDVPELGVQDNLAVRAAHAVQHLALSGSPGVRIELNKRVPTQAGLGGGSSDAAAVLVALNALWSLGLGTTELERIGADLGSDVPFFIRGGTSVVGGRGEQVEPLPDGEQLWLIVAKPPIGVPTPAVFRALTPDDFGHSVASDAIAEATRNGDPMPFDLLHNDLERGVLHNFAAVAQAHDALRRAGAPVVRMSGSGSALFAPFRMLDAAAEVYTSVAATGLPVWLTHTIAARAVHGEPLAAWQSAEEELRG